MEGTTMKYEGYKIGPVIRDIRKDKGLLIEEVAAKTGISVSTLGQVEQGGRNLTSTSTSLWSRGRKLSLPQPNMRVNAGTRFSSENSSDGFSVTTKTYPGNRASETENSSPRLLRITLRRGIKASFKVLPSTNF